MPNSTALIINHENISYNWYVGKDRNFLVGGALFRLGGGAALMSNRYERPAHVVKPHPEADLLLLLPLLGR